MLHLENFFEKSFALLLTTPILGKFTKNCLIISDKCDKVTLFDN